MTDRETATLEIGIERTAPSEPLSTAMETAP